MTRSMGTAVAAADAKADDIVTLPGGTQTTVGAALASGLLDPNFRNAAPSSFPVQQQQEQTEQPQIEQKPAEDAARYMVALEKDNPQAIVNSPDGQKLGSRIEQDSSVTIKIPEVGRVGWQTALRSRFIAPRFGQVPAPRAPVQQQTPRQPAPGAQASNYVEPNAAEVASFRAAVNDRTIPGAVKKQIVDVFSRRHGPAATKQFDVRSWE
jgi:hypothetical protein